MPVEAPPAFDQFVAIDWSGARGGRHRSIVVARCSRGAGAPAILPAPGRGWARREVLDWLREIARRDERTLIGFDFSFAPPFVARRSYLPGTKTPGDAPGFWGFVDAACADADLGAASFLETTHRRHFYLGATDGPKADFVHHRVCEAAFNASGGGKASSVYDAIGAAQVAKASFAGMRLLHALGRGVPVWPFDPVPATGPLVVEIYCRAFLRLAGGTGRKVRSAEGLDTALARLGSDPHAGGGMLTDHDTDALVSSAGLRYLHADPRYWHPAGLTGEVAATEGWTWGVA